MNAPPEVSAAYVAATEKQRALALALAQGMGKVEAMEAAGYSKAQSHKCPKEVIEHPRVVILAGWYASQAMAKEVDKVERAVDRMADIALFDPKSIHDEGGKVLPVDQWPESARSAFADEVKATLLPGVEVVPSMVVTLQQAQARGCQYIYAGS